MVNLMTGQKLQAFYFVKFKLMSIILKGAKTSQIRNKCFFI